MGMHINEARTENQLRSINDTHTAFLEVIQIYIFLIDRYNEPILNVYIRCITRCFARTVYNCGVLEEDVLWHG